MARSNPLAVSSNYAREYAAGIAAAASCGLITTYTGTGYGRRWRPTVAGLQFINTWEASCHSSPTAN